MGMPVLDTVEKLEQFVRDMGDSDVVAYTAMYLHVNKFRACRSPGTIPFLEDVQRMLLGRAGPGCPGAAPCSRDDPDLYCAAVPVDHLALNVRALLVALNFAYFGRLKGVKANIDDCSKWEGEAGELQQRRNQVMHLLRNTGRGKLVSEIIKCQWRIEKWFSWAPYPRPSAFVNDGGGPLAQSLDRLLAGVENASTSHKPTSSSSSETSSANQYPKGQTPKKPTDPSIHLRVNKQRSTGRRLTSRKSSTAAVATSEWDDPPDYSYLLPPSSKQAPPPKGRGEVRPGEVAQTGVQPSAGKGSSTLQPLDAKPAHGEAEAKGEEERATVGDKEGMGKAKKSQKNKRNKETKEELENAKAAPTTSVSSVEAETEAGAKQEIPDEAKAEAPHQPEADGAHESKGEAPQAEEEEAADKKATGLPGEDGEKTTAKAKRKAKGQRRKERRRIEKEQEMEKKKLEEEAKARALREQRIREQEEIRKKLEKRLAEDRQRWEEQQKAREEEEARALEEAARKAEDRLRAEVFEERVEAEVQRRVQEALCRAEREAQERLENEVRRRVEAEKARHEEERARLEGEARRRVEEAVRKAKKAEESLDAEIRRRAEAEERLELEARRREEAEEALRRGTDEARRRVQEAELQAAMAWQQTQLLQQEYAQHQEATRSDEDVARARAAERGSPFKPRRQGRRNRQHQRARNHNRRGWSRGSPREQAGGAYRERGSETAWAGGSQPYTPGWITHHDPPVPGPAQVSAEPVGIYYRYSAEHQAAAFNEAAGAALRAEAAYHEAKEAFRRAVDVRRRAREAFREAEQLQVRDAAEAESAGSETGHLMAAAGGPVGTEDDYEARFNKFVAGEMERDGVWDPEARYNHEPRGRARSRSVSF